MKKNTVDHCVCDFVKCERRNSEICHFSVIFFLFMIWSTLKLKMQKRNSKKTLEGGFRQKIYKDETWKQRGNFCDIKKFGNRQQK